MMFKVSFRGGRHTGVAALAPAPRCAQEGHCQAWQECPGTAALTLFTPVRGMLCYLFNNLIFFSFPKFSYNF